MHQVAHLGQFVSERLDFRNQISLLLILVTVQDLCHLALMIRQDGNDRDEKYNEWDQHTDLLRAWHSSIMTSNIVTQRLRMGSTAANGA